MLVTATHREFSLPWSQGPFWSAGIHRLNPAVSTLPFSPTTHFTCVCTPSVSLYTLITWLPASPVIHSVVQTRVTSHSLSSTDPSKIFLPVHTLALSLPDTKHHRCTCIWPATHLQAHHTDPLQQVLWMTTITLPNNRNRLPSRRLT